MKDFSGLGTLLTLHSRRALFLTLCTAKFSDFSSGQFFEHVELFLAGLQTENFIFCCVKFLAGSPTSDCEICLAENKIFSFSPRQEKINML